MSNTNTPKEIYITNLHDKDFCGFYWQYRVRHYNKGVVPDPEAEKYHHESTLQALKDRAAQQAKLAKERFETIQALREEKEKLIEGIDHLRKIRAELVDRFRECREENQSLQAKVERLRNTAYDYFLLAKRVYGML